MSEDHDSLSFWAGHWNVNNIFWHLNTVNPMLQKYCHLLTSQQGNSSQGLRSLEDQLSRRFFIPLCGKSVDMSWLYRLGHSVVGVECVAQAIEEFFKDEELDYVIDNSNGFKIYKTMDGRLQLWQCDLFDLTSDLLGSFDVIWDRASLVALYPEDRERYATLLRSVCKPDTRYMLHVLEYNDTTFKGPPRNVSLDMVHTIFGADFWVELLESDCGERKCKRKILESLDMGELEQVIIKARLILMHPKTIRTNSAANAI